MKRRHTEQHRSSRIGWLRAAVLGANDGIVSTASLVLGVAAAGAEHQTIVHVGRGLDAALADHVAGKLMAHDALSAHARDELGLSDVTAARPMQAALASAASFSVGAVLPIAVVAATALAHLIFWVSVSSLFFFGCLGAFSAQAGGARVWVGAWRVALWGAVAMAVTGGAGALFDALA